MTEDKTVKGILHGVPVTVTIKGKPDYTPTTEDVRREYAIAREGIESPDEVVAQFDRWLAEVKAQAIGDAIAYLKTTPAVTLTGKGGGYELLEAYRQGEEQ